MNERVLSILRRIARTTLTGKAPARDEVRQTLLRDGYTTREIDAAFRWLDRSDDSSRPASSGAPVEPGQSSLPPGAALTGAAMGFLQMLRDLAYLDDRLEGDVLNRLTAVANGEVSLADLRRAVAEVMFEHQFELDSELLTLLDEEWKMVFH